MKKIRLKEKQEKEKETADGLSLLSISGTLVFSGIVNQKPIQKDFIIATSRMLMARIAEIKAEYGKNPKNILTVEYRNSMKEDIAAQNPDLNEVTVRYDINPAAEDMVKELEDAFQLTIDMLTLAKLL